MKRIEGKITSTSMSTTQVDDNNAIIFTNVPIYSPNGDLLVKVRRSARLAGWALRGPGLTRARRCSGVPDDGRPPGPHLPHWGGRAPHGHGPERQRQVVAGPASR